MKIVLFGATGNCGQRLMRCALDAGHTVTAFVRNPQMLREQCGSDLPVALSVMAGDIADERAVAGAIDGHAAVINAAGNVADGQAFVELVDRIVTQTQAVLGDGGRLWLFGGAAALDVPGTKVMGADLSMVPPLYQSHKMNFDRVMESSLDFSMLCPGPMVALPDGKARTDLRVSIDEWPFERPWYTFGMPEAALSLALMRHVREMTISYEDAAQFVIDNLEPSNRYTRRRIGLAKPKAR
ncbi:NAD(P)-dependent oxidoreductase [Hoeflea sp. TYP-13]|uniref:NAD(P)-dependent oxidoreductase n=1 Tax=Hoeflea sp. TYP-13 TaxID=3230023 RepID=UPI0034C61B2B